MFLRVLKFFFIVGGIGTNIWANESFYGAERIGDFFLQSYRVEETNPHVKLSGELLYFSQGVGLILKKGKCEPGYRITLEREAFFKSFDLGVSYMYWGAERKKSFSMSILKQSRILTKTQTISNKDRLDDLEVRMAHVFSFLGAVRLKPYLGIEWDWRDTHVKGERCEILNRQRVWGPLVGGCVGVKLNRYFDINGGVSFTYLEGSYQRIINQTIGLENRCLGYKSKSNLGVQGTFPLEKGSVKIKGGYETQYLWMPGIDGLIDWDSPLYLQGFFAEVSLSF